MLSPKPFPFLLTLLVLHLPAAVHKMGNAVEFRYPDNWALRSDAQTAILIPPGVSLASDTGGRQEVYFLRLMPELRDARDPKLRDEVPATFLAPQTPLREAVAPRPFQGSSGTGTDQAWDFDLPGGETGRLRIIAVDLPGGGVAALCAIGPAPNVAQRDAELSSIVSTIAPPPPEPQTQPDTSPLAWAWSERLRGKVIAATTGMSRSTIGALSSTQKLYLDPAGTFTRQSISGVSIGSQKRDPNSGATETTTGRWRIFTRGRQAYLELTADSGQSTLLVLQSKGRKTLINGAKVSVIDPPDNLSRTQPDK